MAGERREARPRRAALTLATAIGLWLVVWGARTGAGALDDNSFFTHLATGRLILESGVPHADVFSFTAPGATWTVQSWLASTVYALVEATAGGAGLRWLTAALTGGLAALVWMLTRPAGALVVRLALAGAVLAIGSSLWSERPLLLGLVLLGVTLLAAEERLPAWTALPVLAVWVNVHGSFPLGLAAIGALGVGRALDGEPWRHQLWVLGWGVAGTLGGAVVSPVGLGLLTFPIELLGRRDILAEVTEWQAPSFQRMFERVFLVELVVTVVALVRRPSWRAAVPWLIFVPASLLALRNIAVASIVLLPGAARGLADLGRVDGTERSVAATVVGALALVAAPLLVAQTVVGSPAFSYRGYPVAALAWMDREDLLAEADVRLVARDGVGNLLTLREGVDAHVFVDDRFDMYPRTVLHDHRTLLTAEPGWQEALVGWDADVVLWERDRPLSSVLAASPCWRIAYGDDDWVVALPRRCAPAPAG